MSANSSAQKYLDVLLGSDVRADLVALFHRNPGLIDTAEGISRRIGQVHKAVQADLDELAVVGLLSKKKFGNQEVFYLNHAKDLEIQDSIATHLQSVKPSA
ncbi:MAG: hypothetical protein OK457_06545 [Thaumarchaeota archaeon]|nr:hypothetical protein [Nitrososphaerota archaeon]